MPSQSSPPMSKTRGEVLSKKLLGIDPHERYKRYPPYVEQRAREALTPAAAQPFFEEEPTVAEFLRRLRPTGQGAVRYCNSLFPSLGWLPRYNWRWLLGDSIAGEFLCTMNTPKNPSLLPLDIHFLIFPGGRGFLVYLVICCCSPQEILLLRRPHYWICRHSPGNGICPSRSAQSRVRSLHVFYWRSILLVIRYFEGYCHRCKCHKNSLPTLAPPPFPILFSYTHFPPC